MTSGKTLAEYGGFQTKPVIALWIYVSETTQYVFVASSQFKKMYIY